MPVAISRDDALHGEAPGVAQDPSGPSDSYKNNLAPNMISALVTAGFIVLFALALVRLVASIRRKRDTRARDAWTRHSDCLRLQRSLVSQQRLYPYFARPPPPFHDMDEKSQRGRSSGDGTAVRLREDGTGTGTGTAGARGGAGEGAAAEVGASSDLHELSSPPRDGSRTKGEVFMSRHIKSRAPPPPPLTPPEPSGAHFIFDDPRRAFAPPAELPASFHHQPNPDYFSSTGASASASTSTGTTSTAVPAQPRRTPESASPSTARRRSYTKTVPIGIPAPPSSGGLGVDLMFSPSSYPPSSPQLPPPYDSPVRSPPQPLVVMDGNGDEMEMQGEIISLMDHAGAGWKRHTRVYGGGVCLACAASEGGYYGENVREEEKR